MASKIRRQSTQTVVPIQERNQVKKLKDSSKELSKSQTSGLKASLQRKNQQPVQNSNLLLPKTRPGAVCGKIEAVKEAKEVTEGNTAGMEENNEKKIGSMVKNNR